MERVIKFRAFNTEDKEMYSHGVALKLLYESEISNEPIPGKWRILQFTGLHDKNGKEIYEGDILHLNYEGIRVDGLVKAQETGTWVLENKERGTLLGIHHNNERVEIIGNIFSNPELLKA